MDINEIQALIKFVAKSGVSEVELETKGFKIVIKTPQKDAQVIQMPAQPQVQMMPQFHQAPAPVPATPAPAAPSEAKAPAGGADESRYITIKSPMIGTFYRSAGPDKPAFVNVGDEIKPGSVLCIIEAMKLFNEIEADVKGRIVKVLVDDAKPVEYDQPLFLIDPS